MSSNHSAFDQILAADFIVCLGLETTIPDAAIPGLPRNYRRLFLDDSLAFFSGGKAIDIAERIEDTEAAMSHPNFAKVVEMDWAIYDRQRENVAAEKTVFVNSGDNPVTNETQRVSGVSQSRLIQEGVSFSEAISQLNQQLTNLGSQNVVFLTFGDWVTEYQLKLEAKIRQVALPY